MSKEEREALKEVKSVIDGMYKCATIHVEQPIKNAQEVIVAEIEKNNEWLAVQIKIKAMIELLKALDKQVEDLIED